MNNSWNKSENRENFKETDNKLFEFIFRILFTLLTV